MLSSCHARSGAQAAASRGRAECAAVKRHTVTALAMRLQRTRRGFPASAARVRLRVSVPILNPSFGRAAAGPCVRRTLVITMHTCFVFRVSLFFRFFYMCRGMGVATRVACGAARRRGSSLPLADWGVSEDLPVPTRYGGEATSEGASRHEPRPDPPHLAAAPRQLGLTRATQQTTFQATSGSICRT